MDKLKFIIVLLATISLTYLLHNPIPLESNPIPPLGKLLNPFTGFWQNAEKVNGFPKVASLDGLDLNAPVKVIYDDKLVPHIFAENLTDAMMVQGYIESKHRLWQMDFTTRATSGRLSEVLGEQTIEFDKGKRRKGLVYAAQNTLKSWKKTPVEFALVEAYIKGANTYINSLSPKDYPLEFKFLNYTPEEWTPLKSAIYMKAMAESLSSRETDLEATNALATFGRVQFDFLYPERSDKESPIIPTDVEWDFKSPLSDDLIKSPSIGAIFHEPYEKPHESNGSNNWVVAGSKTASGNPILCNDPHLSLTLPAVWFEIQIHTPTTNVYGVSLPGVPGVTIGFNENVAWGFTNVGHDVSDLYKIKWVDESKEAYIFDGESKPTQYVIETIKVNGQSDILDTVKYTHWGPVSYENKDHPRQDLALHWLAHESKGNELKTFLGVNSAKNFEEFYEGMREFDNPAQNVAFATKDGTIGLKVQGKLPIKEKEQGRFVRDGSLSSSGWKGYIPFEETPFVKNPTQGFVGSANQFSTDTTYPYYYNGGFEDFRGRVLNRTLAAMSNITIQDMKDLQGNNFSIKAAETLPIFLQFLKSENLSTEEKELFDVLKKWDYNFDKDEVAPVIFDHWYNNFYKKTWDEIYALRKKEFPMLFPEHWRTIELLEKNPDNIFFDLKETTEKETAKDIALMTFKEVVKNAQEWKKDGNFVTWEDHRDIKIPHMINSLKGFQSDFVSAGGHGNVLNAFGIRGKNVHGPSWRMIVEVGDEPKAYGVYPAGQSGNPGSPFYESMVKTWASGEYYELLFFKDKNVENDRILFRQEFN